MTRLRVDTAGTLITRRGTTVSACGLTRESLQSEAMDHSGVCVAGLLCAVSERHDEAVVVRRRYGPWLYRAAGGGVDCLEGEPRLACIGVASQRLGPGFSHRRRGRALRRGRGR